MVIWGNTLLSAFGDDILYPTILSTLPIYSEFVSLILKNSPGYWVGRVLRVLVVEPRPRTPGFSGSSWLDKPRPRTPGFSGPLWLSPGPERRVSPGPHG